MNQKVTNIIDDHAAPILIIDDNNNYSKVLQKLLNKTFGFDNITIVESTEESFSLIKKNEDFFKILFVDLNFPFGDDGFTFIKKLKENNLIKKKIIFLITSDPSSEKLGDITTLGAVGIVGKPFNKEQIISQLEKARSFNFADSLDYF